MAYVYIVERYDEVEKKIIYNWICEIIRSEEAYFMVKFDSKVHMYELFVLRYEKVSDRIIDKLREL